ncbi:transposable element Tc1 transposase [Trichonephila clavipes]|nr:transposable element Tc1 transposase [Trichonephila clavipes]
MPWIPLPLDKGSEEFMEMEQKQERYGSPVSETEVTHVVGPVAWGPLIIDMVDTAVATQLSEFESRTDSVFDAPITQDELAYVLRNHPCGKSPGGDGIHSEFLAYLGPRAFQTVWKFFDLIWNTETSGLLAKEQAGFRSSKSIHQHPALVSQLVKDALDNRQALTAVFIDLKSAYDNVWRACLLLQLTKIGIRANLFNWIGGLLCQRCCRVRYVGCHLYGKSVHEIADILKKPKSTVSDVIVKRRGSETADKRTGRPKVLGERSRRTLKRVVKQNRKSSLVEISQEFQCLSGISVSSKTIRRELKNLGFHGREATHKPNIIPQNAKHRLQWCRSHRHWTVDM